MKHEASPSAGVGRATRRDFLKTSTTLIGVAAASGLMIGRSAHAAGSDVIKVGLIGCGGRGSGAAKDILVAPDKVQLVAMGDAFENRLSSSLNELQKQFADQKGRIDVPKERQFVGFDAYQKVIDSDVDMVILATPPGFRPIHFKAAIAAGKHVFMEKPVAVDAPGVRSVLATAAEAKKKNLAVGVGLQRHHQNLYLETIKRLQDGAIGDIHTMRAYWNGAGVWVNPRQMGQTEMEYQMRNWYYFNWLCGDHIVEQHIHNLDVINWLKGANPVRCHGMGGRQVRVGKEYGEIFDHHAVEFEYADGSRLFSQCRHIPECWDSITEHCQGSKGQADISAGVIQVKGGETWKYGRRTKTSDPNPYEQEHADLLAGIRSGKPLNEAVNGALSSLTSIMGRMATYSGKIVTWDQALNSTIDLSPKKYAFDADPQSLPDKEGRYKIAVPGQTAAV